MHTQLVQNLFQKLKAKGWMIATAESCTGGLISAVLTAEPGSSLFVDRGYVTYSNSAKSEMLFVPPALIEKHGAVSAEVAKAMAEGALNNSRANITVAVTGIAGPGGGTEEKPVGLVYIAVISMTHVNIFEHRFTGDRHAVRQQTVTSALQHVMDML